LLLLTASFSSWRSH